MDFSTAVTLVSGLGGSAVLPQMIVDHRKKCL